MSLEIDSGLQWLLLAKAVLLGAVFGVVYDIFRFIRTIKKCGKFEIAIQDILFWLLLAIAVFGFMMVYCSGVVRLYLVAGVLVGGFLYYFSIGKLTVLLFRGIKKVLDAVAAFLNKYLLSPLFKLIKVTLMKLKQGLNMLFSPVTKIIKNFFKQKQKTTCK